MLVLTCKLGESVVVDGPGTVRVLRVDSKNQVRLGVTAPKTTYIKLVNQAGEEKCRPARKDG